LFFAAGTQLIEIVVFYGFLISHPVGLKLCDYQIVVVHRELFTAAPGRHSSDAVIESIHQNNFGIELSDLSSGDHVEEVARCRTSRAPGSPDSSRVGWVVLGTTVP
jgi:hypothetical protein